MERSEAWMKSAVVTEHRGGDVECFGEETVVVKSSTVVKRSFW